MQRLADRISQDVVRDELRNSLLRWESVLLTCVTHLRRMWADPNRPSFLRLEEEETILRRAWIEHHMAFLNDETAAASALLAPRESQSYTRTSPPASSSMQTEFPRPNVPPPKGSSSASSGRDTHPALQAAVRAVTVVAQPSDSVLAQRPVKSRAGAVYRKRSHPSEAAAVEARVAQTSVQPAPPDSAWSVTGSDTLWMILSFMILCRSQSVRIHRDGVLVHRSLLPSIPLALVSEATAPTVWIEVPSLEWLAWPVLRRLRLWSLQHTHERRRSRSWPTEREIEDVETICAALVAVLLPIALKRKDGPAAPGVTAARTLVWEEDERALRDIRAWQPVPPEQSEGDEADDTASAPHRLRISDILPASIRTRYALPSAEHDRSATSSHVAVVLANSGAESKRAGEMEEDLEAKRKREQEIPVDQKTSDEGRMWSPVFRVDGFLAEVDSLLHGIMLQDYTRSVSGVVVNDEQMPIVHAGMTDALRALMLERCSMESGDDRWNAAFRDCVFEHYMPIGARSLNKRAVLFADQTSAEAIQLGSRYLLEQTRANARPMTVVQNEIGVKVASQIDKMLDQHAKSRMLEADHPVHDLFVLNFFSYILFHETQGMLVRPPEMPQAVDFLNLYYLAPQNVEGQARDLLLKTRRWGMPRRPVVAYLCKRWMVHDIVEVPREQQLDVQRDMERKYDDCDDADHADDREASFRHAAVTPAQAVGLWYDCEDSVEKALLTWLCLVKARYGCNLEDGSNLSDLCDRLHVE